MEYRAIYDGEYISHYGRKGMRWGHRKDGGPQGYLGTYPKAGLHDVHSLTNVSGKLSIGRNSKRRRMQSYIHATRGKNPAYRQRLAKQAEKHYKQMSKKESDKMKKPIAFSLAPGLLATGAGVALSNPPIVALGASMVTAGGFLTAKHAKKSTMYDKRREIAVTAFNKEMKNHESDVWFDESLRPHDKDTDAFVKENFDSRGKYRDTKKAVDDWKRKNSIKGMRW